MSESFITEQIEIQKRAERLSAGIFLVSGVMQEDNILKTKVRELSLDLVVAASSLKGHHAYDDQRLFSIIDRIASQLLSFLNIALVSSQISPMNGSILKNEMENFLNKVTQTNSSFMFGGVSFPKDFFQPEKNAVDPKDMIFISDKNEEKHIATIHDKRYLDKEKVGRKEHRNKSILSLIAKNKEVSIKDISHHIKGCSEKTVQRELNALIAAGLVRKTGERRWSRYSLFL